MTKEELKKKIVEVVNQWHMFQNRDINGHTIWLTNDSEKLADALIDAGIGDVKELNSIKTELRQKVDYINELWEVKEDYKHRAAKAERALELMARGECTFDSPEYYKEQAEKELAEERKDD